MNLLKLFRKNKTPEQQRIDYLKSKLKGQNNITPLIFDKEGKASYDVKKGKIVDRK